MPAARTIRRRDAQLTFEAIAIEGGLLSPEWLARVAQLDAGGQTEADYGVPKGLNLRDEIGRFWRIAQAHWADFAAGRAASADPEALARTFATALLRDALGFTSLAKRQPERIGDRDYPVPFAALEGRVPIVVAPAGSELDTPAGAFGDGTRRRSAFGLLQEYLNAADPARWGIATDGLTLRIGRDNASLTRPAWIEADLGRIFAEERYADFAALWLLAHGSRFGKPGEPTDNCPLERWRQAGREQGTRAREHLRAGVEQALLALGQGFLSHPDNQALRRSLQDGTLTRMAYFQELLRLVYRLIFLLTIEERGLLHPGDVSDEARKLYASGYSVSKLRDRSVKRSAHDRFADLWESTKVVFRALRTGEPRLGLPALSGLFDAEQCPNVDGARLENWGLLVAIFRLGWLRESSGLARVNWRDMGPEELGSVYESLLELVPQITHDGRQFTFAAGGQTKGNARKTSGSYYTPDSLVQVLLDSALEPVVKDTIAGHPEDPVAALLQLSIVDPACGSGHFLLAAGRRVAAHVARLRANGTPSVAEYQHALREVVGRCIYGVDLNPMAVELCRVSLWMEAVEPGLPLTFLDSHIQQGNALLGTTPGLMADGIPDEAWSPVEGDDRKVASAIKRRNNAEREGQRSLIERWSGRTEDRSDELLRAVEEVEAAPDADLHSLARKRAAWDAVVGSDLYRHKRFVADAWCATFVWPKQPGPIADLAPTQQQWLLLQDPRFEPPALALDTVDHLSRVHSFFHWHLRFAQVFAAGGFDVVLGNPPWERLTLRDQEWFGGRDPEIARAKNAAERRRRIATLISSQPDLLSEFRMAKRASIGEKNFSRMSGYFPLTGVGDVNTYALFAETAQRIAKPDSFTALILPTGIATTDTTKDFFSSLVENGKLRSLFDFDNRGGLFPAVQGNVRFCLLVTGGHNSAFMVASQLTAPLQLRERGRISHLTSQDLARINPATRTCPLFTTVADGDIIKGIYERVPVLEEVESSSAAGWRVALARMLHMGDDSEAFRTDTHLSSEGAARIGEGWTTADGIRYLPLYESKFCDHFNHRASTFAGIPLSRRFGTHPATRELSPEQLADPSVRPEPRYWAPESLALEWAAGRRLLLGFRNAISATADARSLNACLMPLYPAGDSLKFITSDPESDVIWLVAMVNSFVVDFVFRQKATGANASFFLIRQLPILAKSEMLKACPWTPVDTTGEWIRLRVMELSYTATDMARLSATSPIFVFESQRRDLLRHELDAALFVLYGLSRSEAGHILDTFSIVRKNDERTHGEYRTKRVILEIYDEMAEAARTGQPYVTRLDPPPADPRVAHPDTGLEVV